MSKAPVISKAVLEQLRAEQEVISRRFGRNSRAMYDNLSAGVKKAFNDFPPEIVAQGADMFEIYVKRCGYTIE